MRFHQYCRGLILGCGCELRLMFLDGWFSAGFRGLNHGWNGSLLNRGIDEGHEESER